MRMLCLLALFVLADGLMAPTVRAQTATNKPVRALPVQLNPAPLNFTPSAAPETPPSLIGIAPPQVGPVSASGELTNSILAFDRETQETLVTDGAPAAQFRFSFTNVSSARLTITNVAVSCGCTAVELPPLPWVLQPGERGAFPVTMEIAGKRGVIFKSLQVRTDRGVKTLMVKADIKPPPESTD